MKLKEVCNLTGLSKKTIRLYEEKQLFFPKTEYRNGRMYREYSEEDVSILMEVSILRKALFTMDEIYTMQQEPEEIEAIVEDYARRINEFAATLKILSDTVKTIEPSRLQSVSELAKAMNPAAEIMPLPSYDAKPNFRRLDELEELPPHVELQTNLDEMVPNRAVFNQMVAAMIGDKTGVVGLSQVHATRKAFQEKHTIIDRELPKEPLPLRIIKGTLTAGILILTMALIYRVSTVMFGAWELDWSSWIPVITWDLILLSLRIAITYIPAFIAHRKWLKSLK